MREGGRRAVKRQMRRGSTASCALPSAATRRVCRLLSTQLPRGWRLCIVWMHLRAVGKVGEGGLGERRRGRERCRNERGWLAP